MLQPFCRRPVSLGPGFVCEPCGPFRLVRWPSRRQKWDSACGQEPAINYIFLGGRSPFMPKNNMIQARASFEARYPNVLPGTLASRAAAH